MDDLAGVQGRAGLSQLHDRHDSDLRGDQCCRDACPTLRHGASVLKKTEIYI